MKSQFGWFATNKCNVTLASHACTLSLSWYYRSIKIDDLIQDEDELARKGCHIVKLLDGKGDTLALIQYEDILFNTYALKFIDPATQIQSIKQLPYRSGDVLLCTYPKSATSSRTGYVVVPNLELTPHDRINALPSPRLLHSHLRFERLPSEHVTFGGKIILTVRNPKDVAISLYHHMIRDVAIRCKLSWNDFLKYFMTENMVMGSYFDYLRSWDHVIRTNKKLNILVVYYENLLKDTIKEMRNIREFLGICLDDLRLQNVIDMCSFNTLRENTNSRNHNFVAVDDNGISVIYRKGVIGDWMNHFTVSQNEEFNKMICDKLSATMFKFEFQSTVQ